MGQLLPSPMCAGARARSAASRASRRRRRRSQAGNRRGSISARSSADSPARIFRVRTRSAIGAAGDGGLAVEPSDMLVDAGERVQNSGFTHPNVRVAGDDGVNLWPSRRAAASLARVRAHLNGSAPRRSLRECACAIRPNNRWKRSMAPAVMIAVGSVAIFVNRRRAGRVFKKSTPMPAKAAS
jgi:hypothetical protein